MPMNAYFARYQSPNIIIVPTVSFSCAPPPHTGTEQNIADPHTTTSSPTSLNLNCEPLTPVKDSIGEPSASPCRLCCNQENLQVTSLTASTSTEFSDNVRNSLYVKQDTISTEAHVFSMSQSIQDLSTSKYKSRNNLVDLTGFNLPKRERDSTSSLPKRKVLGQIDDTEIKQDNMKTSYGEKEHRNYSDNDSNKTSTSEVPMSTYSEGNTENIANGEPKENKTDMEIKMKKYFRQLWNRNFDKLKHKAAKEKRSRAIKSSSKTRQGYKDSKQESSRSKANLQKVSKRNSKKDLRNKKIDSSKKYCDLERRSIAKYPKRSKSETKSGQILDPKVCISDRKLDFNPDSIKRCKDLMGHNDGPEIEYKSGTLIKTENLPRKKIQMNPYETSTNKPVIKKKVDERKQSIKTEKRSKVNTNQTNLERVENYTDMDWAKDQSNRDKVKLIKSVVQVGKNFHNNLSQSKRFRPCTPPGDLRSRLSRKRAKSEYSVNIHEPMENRLDQESLMITVKQNEKADSKNWPVLAPTVNKPKPKKFKQESLMITVKQDVRSDLVKSPILAPTVIKPKPKKCKKIKLIINIESSKSESDSSDQDFNELYSSPEELSFLDDFNIDEIVNLLNNSQVETNQTITTDNDYKNNEQIKHKEGVINNMKVMEMTKKKETNSHNGQVIEKKSDTEDDMNIEIRSVANKKKCQDNQNMEENSKFDRKTKQETNNITELTGNGYEEIAPKEIVYICKDEQNIKTNSKVDRNTTQEANNGKYCDKNAPKETTNISESDDSNYSIVEVIDVTDENEHYLTSKHLQPKKTIQTSTLATKVNLPKSKFQLLNISNKPSVNRRTGIDNTNKKSHNTQHEDKIPLIIDKQKSDPTNIKKKKNPSQFQKSEDPIEASLQKMFNIEEHKSDNSIGVKSDVIKQSNTLDKHVKEKNDNFHNSEDTVEVLLETMFNNDEHIESLMNHIEQNKSNGCDKMIKENSIQKSLGTKYQDTDINMDIEQPSLSVKSEDSVEASLQKNFNIEQNKTANSIGVKSILIKQLNILDNHIKEKNDNFQDSEDTVEASLENMFNNDEHIESLKKHTEQNKMNGCDNKLKENSIQKSLVKVSLESIFNGTEHQYSDINMAIEQPRLSDQHIRKEIHVLQTGQVMIKVPIETMNNIVDPKKNMNEIKIEPSNITDKHIIIESQEPVNQILTETTKTGIEQNSENKINSEPLNVSNSKENRSRKSVSISKKSLETKENILENANNKIDIIPLCRSSNNVKKHLQKSENTVNKPIDNPDKIEKTNNVISSPLSKNQLLFDSRNSTKGILKTAKRFSRNCLTSPQIDIRPQNSLDQNNKPKKESLQKTSFKATIDNSEQKINIRSESNNLVQEITLLSLVNSEVESERSNIQHKTNVTTSVQLTIPDKNVGVTSQKTFIFEAEKSVTSNNRESTLITNKSNVENETKSETAKNNTPKPETIVDAMSALNNVTIKDIELEIATNTQEQEGANKSWVPDGSKNIDKQKYNKQAAFTMRTKPLKSNFQSEISEYLQKKKYTFSSIIHSGRFSTIYKCFDTKGETYAIKAVRQRQTGMFMERMLFLLQQYRSRQDSFVLFLMSAFEVHNQWCLLTEYYPKNLKQALRGYAHGFDIDRVQTLSRQLVDAVNMLTNAGVIHSDIKPSHILLNSAHDRLKLCGFDQSYRSGCYNILLNNGTPSYRAPEMILGFQADHRLDVWSTALVMFEMATNKTLLVGDSNNVILYQQLCTFGSFDLSMLEQSRYSSLYFSGTSFIRHFRYKKSEKTVLLHSLQRNERFRRTLFDSYKRQCAPFSTTWQMTNDMNKVELLYKLLEQMLVLDPRNRLPIQFVGASEFFNYQFAIA